MSSIKRYRVVFRVELTTHKDSEGLEIPLRTNMNSAIWIKLNRSDHPDPIRLNHRLEGRYHESQPIFINPYNGELEISYCYHFGSTKAGNWKYTSQEFKLSLTALIENNIETIDIWNDPAKSVIDLQPLKEKLADIKIKFKKDIGELKNAPRLKALYLMGPIEAGLNTKNKNDELILGQDVKAWEVHRMEALAGDLSYWHTKVSVPLQKIKEYKYQTTFIIIESYYHNRRIQKFRLVGTTNMQISSQMAEQVEGHVQAQMDIILVLNESAGDPLGLEIVDESQFVDSWMVVKYDFDRLNHNLEEEPGEVYMVFEKYGRHKLEKINGRWFLELKILKSEWEADGKGNNIAYEFEYITKNKVKAYKPPVQIIEFNDQKPVVQQLLIGPTKILTYKNIGRNPPPLPEDDPIVPIKNIQNIIKNVHINNIENVTQITQVNNIIDIPTRQYGSGGGQNIGSEGGFQYFSGGGQNIGSGGGSGSSFGRVQNVGSGCGSGWYSGGCSDWYCYEHHVWNCSCRYRSYYNYYYNHQGVQNPTRRQETRVIYYDHVITQYQQAPEFQNIIPILTNNIHYYNQKKQKKQLKDYYTTIIEYKKNPDSCEPEAVEYIMSQVKYLQEQQVELITTEMIRPIDECYKLLDRLVASPEVNQQVKDKLQKIKEVKKLPLQTFDQRNFQLALLSKRWGKSFEDREQQLQIEKQINLLMSDLLSDISDDDVKLILGHFLREHITKLSQQHYTLHYQCHGKLTAPLREMFTEPFEDRLKDTELFRFYKQFTVQGFEGLLNIAAQNQLHLVKDPMKPKLESTLLTTLMIYASIQAMHNERYQANINIYSDELKNCPEFLPYCNETKVFKIGFSDLQRLMQLEPYIDKSISILTQEIQRKRIQADDEFVDQIKQLTTEHQKLIDVTQILFDQKQIDDALLDDDTEELTFDVVIQSGTELQQGLQVRSLMNH